MNTKHFLAGCAAMVLSIATAQAGPCNTRDKDAGSGPTPGSTGQSTTTGSAGTAAHPPTETMNRVTGEKTRTTAWEEHSLDQCKKMHEQTSAVMKNILDHQEEDLFKLFEYKNFAGQTYQSELYDILLQVLTHGEIGRASCRERV